MPNLVFQLPRAITFAYASVNDALCPRVLFVQLSHSPELGRGFAINGLPPTWKSQELKKVISRYAAVLQNSVKKANPYLFRGNRDKRAVALKSHVTTSLPDFPKTEVVTRS
jgi:hypothetical protein